MLGSSPWRNARPALTILEFPESVGRLRALSAKIAAARPLTPVEQVQRFYRPLPGDPPPPPCIYKNTRLQWKLHRDNTLQLSGTRARELTCTRIRHCVALGAKTLPPRPSQLWGSEGALKHLLCKKPHTPATASNSVVRKGSLKQRRRVAGAPRKLKQTQTARLSVLR